MIERDPTDKFEQISIESSEKMEAPCFDFLLEYSALRNLWQADLAFRDGLNFVNQAVTNLDLQDSNFFENENLKADLAIRLLEFSAYLDEEIADVQRLLKGNDSRMGRDWERNLRKACYYAFFVHYGAKRRGEQDRFGKPKDYVYHVVKAAVNCMIRKVRFFDERVVLATVCHDTREDYHKGIFGLLNSDCSQLEAKDLDDKKLPDAVAEGRNKASASGEKILEQMRGMEDELEQGCQRSDLNELTVSELIDIVTKDSGDRNQAALGLLYKVLFEADGSMRSDERLYYALAGVLIKIADRLENIKTFRSQEAEDRKSKNDLIEDETIYLFLAIAQRWRMTNVVDWFFDYIDLQRNPDVRKGSMVIRREGYKRDGQDLLNKEDRLRAKFKRDFCRRLSDLCGRELEEGVDYVFEFREIGHRYSNIDELIRMFLRGDLAKSLRSYMIFHPLEGRGNDLVEAAEILFDDMFDDPMPENIAARGEVARSKLGREIVAHGGLGSSQEYGYGAWGVYDSKSDCAQALLGDYVASRVIDYGFAATSELRASVIAPFKSIVPMVKNLKQEYALLDRAQKSTERVINGSRRSLKEVVGDFVVDGEEGDNEVVQIFKNEEHVVKIKKVLATLVMSLFMPYLSQSRISVNGKIKTTRVPQDVVYDPEANLFYGAPLLLGLPHREPDFIESVFAKLLGSLASDRGVFADSVMTFNINPFAEFDPGIFAQQTEFLDELMNRYREYLLNGQVEIESVSKD